MGYTVEGLKLEESGKPGGLATRWEPLIARLSFPDLLVRLLPFSGEREFRKHGENGQANVFETPGQMPGFSKTPVPELSAEISAL